jgi:Protein of unknown function (DUF2911)
MRHSCLLSALFLLTMAPAAARAQQLELPRASPAAKITQQVGLTEITVDYSSPAVKKRKIWGGLVPYDQTWRTGANASTKVTFSKDVTVNGKPVPAGTYNLLSVPGAKTWTVMLNKDLTLGANVGKYNAELDVAKFPVTPRPIPHRERLTFLFNDVTDDTASLDLEWEKVRVSLPIKTDTDAQVRQSIDRTVGGIWRLYANSARYLMEKKDYDTALKYADQSLALKEDWFNTWVKAQVLAAKGDRKQAHALAEKANQLGSKNPQGFFAAGDVKQALSDWKK